MQVDAAAIDVSKFLDKPQHVYHLLHFITNASSRVLRQLRKSTPALEHALRDIQELVEFWGLEDWEALRSQRGYLMSELSAWAAVTLSPTQLVRQLEEVSANIRKRKQSAMLCPRGDPVRFC